MSDNAKKKTGRYPDPKKKATRTTIYLRNVDPNLKNNFRAHCIQRGTTMLDEIQRLMREALKNQFRTGTKHKEV